MAQALPVESTTISKLAKLLLPELEMTAVLVSVFAAAQGAVSIAHAAAAQAATERTVRTNFILLTSAPNNTLSPGSPQDTFRPAFCKVGVEAEVTAGAADRDHCRDDRLGAVIARRVPPPETLGKHVIYEDEESYAATEP